jgi:hypothetical protein
MEVAESGVAAPQRQLRRVDLAANWIASVGARPHDPPAWTPTMIWLKVSRRT